MSKKIIICCLLVLAWTFTGHAEEGKKSVAPKKIVLETTLGTIRIELFDKKAPISTANFRRYVQESFFNGLIFHRVIPGFVIQGGGFEPGMKQRRPSHPPIKNEADNGLKNARGTLSMARTNQINSATSQFFINVADNKALDHNKQRGQFGYAVFGKVIEGMEVVDKIVAMPTTNVERFQDVPKKDVVILKAYEE